MSYRFNQDMEEALVSIISASAGNITTLWNMQDAFDDRAAVEPIRPFIILNIISGPTALSDYDIVSSDSGVDTEFTYRQLVEFQVSVNVHADNGYLAIANNISLGLRTDKYRQQLKDVGLSLMGYTTIRDISYFDQTRYKLRAQFDLNFNYISVIEDVSIGVFEHIYADGTLGNNNVSIEAHKE